MQVLSSEWPSEMLARIDCFDTDRFLYVSMFAAPLLTLFPVSGALVSATVTMRKIRNMFSI